MSDINHKSNFINLKENINFKKYQMDQPLFETITFESKTLKIT